MKKSSILSVLAVVAVSAACLVGVVGCTPEEEAVPDELTSDTGLTGGVAATVNGVEIEEDKVTRAINNMRLNYGYTEDDKWKEYLERQKDTVESTRYEVIGQLIDQELVKQCAEQLDVTTNDEEIQSYVDEMAGKYSSEEAWLNAVDEAGWESVDKYKEALNFNILEKKLQDKFDADVEQELGDDAKMLEKAQESMATYAGAKKSSRILLKDEDEELANEVYEKISSGEMSFEDAVAEYSTDEDTKENGGDMGWDKIDAPTTEYQEALTNLEVGSVSEPVSDKYGFNIIMCTNVWEAPETLTSTSEVPDDILAEIKTTAIETDGDERYKDWLNGQRPQNDVQVNPMPENVPYWVDMSSVYSEEEAAEINEKALDELINGVSEEETAATTAEATADVAAADAAAADTGAAGTTTDAGAAADTGAAGAAGDAGATTDAGAAGTDAGTTDGS